MSKKSPNPIDVHVGGRVRMRRMLLSMSQEKLGHALGVTFQEVQKYEKGTNRIGASRLQQIASTLKVTPAFFFEGAPGIDARAVLNVVDPLVELGQSRDGLALAVAFNAIADHRARAAIVTFAVLCAEHEAAARKKAA